MGKRQKHTAADELQTGSAVGSEGSTGIEGENSIASASNAEDGPHGASTSREPDTVNIDGRSFTVGETLNIGGREVVVETVKTLKGSSASGVAGGTYLVVSEVVLGRKAYRAVVEGNLFPIRQFGTPGEVISKVRDSQSRPGGVDEKAERPANEGVIHLSDNAHTVVNEIIRFRPELDPSELVSRVVIDTLGPEGERLRKAHEVLAGLPRDLLDLLATADSSKKAEIARLLQ